MSFSIRITSNWFWAAQKTPKLFPDTRTLDCCKDGFLFGVHRGSSCAAWRCLRDEAGKSTSTRAEFRSEASQVWCSRAGGMKWISDLISNYSGKLKSVYSFVLMCSCSRIWRAFIAETPNTQRWCRTWHSSWIHWRNSASCIICLFLATSQRRCSQAQVTPGLTGYLCSSSPHPCPSTWAGVHLLCYALKEKKLIRRVFISFIRHGGAIVSLIPGSRVQSPDRTRNLGVGGVCVRSSCMCGFPPTAQNTH